MDSLSIQSASLLLIAGDGLMLIADWGLGEVK
jgi:hypothetical protein